MKQTRTMKTGIAILLTIALVATGMNVQTFLAKAAEEGNDTGTDSHTEQNIKYEKVDDIKPYRGEVKVAPSTGEGYLFAGWFTDETGQEALGESVTTGVAYAKFVPAHILDVKAQISGTVQKETNASTKTATLRFVTTVDSLKYRKVGFSYSVSEQQSLEYESKYVYTKLHYMGSDQQMEEYFPTEFCSMSQYFKAMTIAGIPESAFATKITIQSYWITQDGTKVLGGIKEVSVQDGLDASFDARISDTDKDTYYVTLGDAVTDAAENDTIEVIRNIELSEEIAIKKSLTITTDGKERTITLKPTDTANVDSRIFFTGCSVYQQ